MNLTFPGLLLALLALPALGAQDYMESRQPCRERDPLMRPFFGDLHVHTRYSLDASTQSTRTTPDQAYRFARGERVGIQPWRPDGSAMRSLQLRRPLDFAMVSDHAELIGEVHMCNTPTVEGYDSWQCMVYRNWPRGAYYLFNYFSSVRASHLGMCGEGGRLCLEAARAPWQEMQVAAEQHYDRSADCRFTSFVGYEWTGVEPETTGNLHRNVVFRNEVVPALPFSYIDGPSADQLWQALDRDCNRSGSACGALAIPHNSNLSAGFMFSGRAEDGSAMTAEYARLRQRMEPVAEIMQHKGASECYFKQGVTRDELCAFEQQPTDNIGVGEGTPRPDTGFLRPALSDGLALQDQLGVNPYRLGFIASTDTHLGTPGAAEEDRFLGHGGAGMPAGEDVPPGLPDKLEYNPGGLAVVWAEENNRTALFRALQRRETYGTSGPRIVSRFFAGWEYPEDLCAAPDAIARAYDGGVPMGGQLVARPAGSPRFLVMASQDPGTPDAPGLPLQRLQLVKGWVDEHGQSMERVVDIAGSADNGARVDTATCETSGNGFASMCKVWVDEDYRPDQRAWYYSRVVENPSCRWSQRICIARGVDCANPATIGEGLEGCCAPEHRPVVQERAWSSPIWIEPAT